MNKTCLITFRLSSETFYNFTLSIDYFNIVIIKKNIFSNFSYESTMVRTIALFVLVACVMATSAKPQRHFGGPGGQGGPNNQNVDGEDLQV